MRILGLVHGNEHFTTLASSNLISKQIPSVNVNSILSD